MRPRHLSIGLIAGAALVAGCGEQAKPSKADPAKLDPEELSTDIDNPYWPMRPGNRWVYSETDDEGARAKVVVTVTDKTRKIANGATARVVRDEVTEDGEPVELTDDRYAEDREGNIWYLGEQTAEYENGKVKTRAGSFEAGKDGAQAGIIMPAHPRPGMEYRQEYYKGEAEDKARVLSLDDQAEVPAGHFRNVLMTKDINPLDPKVLEYKLYARGVGPVLARPGRAADQELPVGLCQVTRHRDEDARERLTLILKMPRPLVRGWVTVVHVPPWRTWTATCVRPLPVSCRAGRTCP